MKSVCDRRALLVVCLALMGFISASSVTVVFLAREEASARRVEADREAERSRQMRAFIADVSTGDPGSPVTVKELLESQGGRMETQLEGPNAQQLLEAIENVRESLGYQD